MHNRRVCNFIHSLHLLCILFLIRAKQKVNERELETRCRAGAKRMSFANQMVWRCKCKDRETSGVYRRCTRVQRRGRTSRTGKSLSLITCVIHRRGCFFALRSKSITISRASFQPLRIRPLHYGLLGMEKMHSKKV